MTFAKSRSRKNKKNINSSSDTFFLYVAFHSAWSAISNFFSDD